LTWNAGMLWFKGGRIVSHKYSLRKWFASDDLPDLVERASNRSGLNGQLIASSELCADRMLMSPKHWPIETAIFQESELRREKPIALIFSDPVLLTFDWFHNWQWSDRFDIDRGFTSVGLTIPQARKWTRMPLRRMTGTKPKSGSRHGMRIYLKCLKMQIVQGGNPFFHI
jgi:hypothetical protein